MGMTIDEAIKQIMECKAYKQCDTEKDSEAFEFAIDTMRKYQQLQADYENRLKADLKAILVDLQFDVEEQKFDVHIDKDVWNDAIRVCSDIIQQKIDKLKEVEE